MKILVTGAAGFIGSHLSEKLVDLGHDVVGLDAYTPYYNPELKIQNTQDLSKKGIEVITADLAEDDLTQIVAGKDVIYHLAAQPGISAHTPFETYLRNNIIATQNLIKTVYDVGDISFFVNIATSSIYGSHAIGDESSAPEPTSHYGVTKLAAEQLIMALNRD